MAKKPSLKEQLDGELDDKLTPERVLSFLRKQRATTAELCEKLKCTEPRLLGAIAELQKGSALVVERGGEWLLSKTPGPDDTEHEYVSRKDGTYLFGFSGDQHLCSKYSRLDVLEDLYDRFAEEKVDRVFNTGNWIDGEARFNVHDLVDGGHGVKKQLDYLANNYPKRRGLTTYAVTGDDHEGWYAQKSGLDIGDAALQSMRSAGRSDWVNLGYMECFVTLRHAKTGRTSPLLVAHPGGGSAYALSYSIQKIVESLDGGEKPAVGLWGHYHKLWSGNIRNVWCIQTGCTQDQTPFMRKKRIDAHVGGGICKLTQDPETGAITRCRVEFFRYFNKGYYNNRWSHSGDVQLPDRV